MSMVFVDRLFLAAYHLDAMTAAVNASVIGLTLICGLGIIASIAEVFVGRRFGAGDEKGIGAPVWQMLWFSLFSTLIFLLAAFYGTKLLFGEGRELDAIYLKWMMIFAPFCLAYQAIAAFYIGQGKTKIIAWVALVTNGVNFFLDYLLIFGVEGWIPELGITGAAIATCVGNLFQTVILFALFIRKKNRDRFGTGQWKLDPPLFKEGVTIGLPAGFSIALELMGWSIFYEVMKRLSDNHIILAGIFQSLLMLLFFIPDGLQKGVIAIVANYIGEKREEVIPKVLRSSFIFIFILFAVALLTSPLTVVWIRHGFLEGQEGTLPSLIYSAWLAVLFYITFEGIRVSFIALLTAYKETRFILLTGASSAWLFIALPFTLLLTLTHPSEITALLLALLFPFGHSLLLYIRARTLLVAGDGKRAEGVSEDNTGIVA